MRPLRFRFSIATFAVVVALVAIDLVWMRAIFTTQRSVFGFAKEGYDVGLFLMAHVLPFGLYPMIRRRGAEQGFLIGFEAGGVMAALGYAAFAWIAPDALSAVASPPLDAIWNLCFSWLVNGTLEHIIVFVLFLALGLGGPQLLIALVCGILIRRRFERRCTVVTDSRRCSEVEGPPKICVERSSGNQCVSDAFLFNRARRLAHDLRAFPLPARASTWLRGRSSQVP
jgi:hypothetical protein